MMFTLRVPTLVLSATIVVMTAPPVIGPAAQGYDRGLLAEKRDASVGRHEGCQATAATTRARGSPASYSEIAPGVVVRKDEMTRLPSCRASCWLAPSPAHARR